MKKTKFTKILMVVMFIFTGALCQAQSWSEMTSWFRNQGVEYLAVYAHPVADMVDYKILSSTSSNIIVAIEFEGVLTDYISKYEILKGTYDGVPYFQTIRVLQDDAFGTSFVTWSAAPKVHSLIYDQMDEAGELWGESLFSNLSPNKKAAAALCFEFWRYYMD